MKGYMILEYPFKMFLYLVVILVVIGLVLTFRDQIINALNLCQYIPQGCPKQEECPTTQAKEMIIDEAVLRKYCNLCWERVGKGEYKKDCLCFVVSGKYTPIKFEHANCELGCDEEVTSVLFVYDGLLKKIYIKC